MIKFSKVSQKIYEVNISFIFSNKFRRNTQHQAIKSKRLSVIKHIKLMILVKKKWIKYSKVATRVKKYKKLKAK
jgi:hypothetical protein